MLPVLLSGSAHPALVTAVARELGVVPGECAVQCFPDGEVHVAVDPRAVDGRAVSVIQPTSNPSSARLFELLLVADASRRAGATSVSAVIPYFGYARQDRTKAPGEALGLRVVTEMLATAGIQRVTTVDPHGNALEAALAMPLERLSAVRLLAEAIDRKVGRERAVVVAPDLGAVPLAREVGRILEAPLGVVQKVRKSGTEVEVETVAGDVRGLRPILVDDMVATGGTIVAAARALAALGAEPGIVVAATHAVLTPGATARMREVGLRKLLVTDTIPLGEGGPEVVSVASLLASSIRRSSAA